MCSRAPLETLIPFVLILELRLIAKQLHETESYENYQLKFISLQTLSVAGSN